MASSRLALPCILAIAGSVACTPEPVTVAAPVAAPTAATPLNRTTAPPVAPSVARTTPEPAGLRSPEPTIVMPVDGARPAVVSLPLGATGPRPVVVVAHGAGGRPETHCGIWRRVIGDRAFALCVRGHAMHPEGRRDRPPTGFFHDGHPDLAKTISRSLAALQARFPHHVDLKRPVFAGYSQGANMGAMLLPDHPARFERAALIEGGVGMFQEWDIRTAKRYRRHGGRRVLLACGRANCAKSARASASYLERGGVAARVVHAVGAGHTYAGAVEQQVGDAFAWLIEGDARW